jgi:hypothetical protein
MRFASAHSADGRGGARSAALGAIMAVAMLLPGCNPTTTQPAAWDPADPAAPVRGVGYRSTIAPYTSLRPVTPAPWRRPDDRPAPQPRSGREAQ